MEFRQRLFYLWRLASVMLDRRRLRILLVAVVTLMVCLQLNLDQLCVDRQSASSPESFSLPDAVSMRLPSLSGEKRRRLATGRVVLETKQRTNCNGDVGGRDPDFLTGGLMLANHTVRPLAAGYTFDPEGGSDVLVFLHIQKTGGTTFGRHLVSNLIVRTPCICLRERKKCNCRNSADKIWTVNRYATGWRCGLHADWTELTQCVDKMLDKAEGSHRERRYLYITILRDPYTRYISEFKHVQRGATWKAARLQCDGRQASLEEVPFCFHGSKWTGVTLDTFMNCPHNLANNRQVRMLANLSLSGCYKNDVMLPESRDCVMLKSAKQNLRQMAFFGLTEYQQETQYLFEKTFGLKFRRNFFQYNRTHASEVGIGQPQKWRILELNKLDAELYQYAKDVFFRRLERALREDYDGKDDGGKREGDWHAKITEDYRSRTSGGEDYEEGDENDAEDDDEHNDRISQQKRVLPSAGFSPRRNYNNAKNFVARTLENA